MIDPVSFSPASQEAGEKGRRFRLTLEYDGTGFAGFQIQGKGERTVQGTLEAVLTRLTGTPGIRVHGAGRTDAGVHALGQVVHFDTRWRIPADRAARVLNGALPDDLKVRALREAEDPGFHARYDATGRIYRYVILNREAPSALLGRFALHVRDPLDIPAMQEVAAALVGTHDFASFGAPDAPGKSTVRRIVRLEVRPWRDCVLITVEGNAFLRQMVRAFVGTLLETGRGRLGPQDVLDIRERQDRAACPPIAPARGLCLVRVRYDGVRYTGSSDDGAFEEDDQFGPAGGA